MLNGYKHSYTSDIILFMIIVTVTLERFNLEKGYTLNISQQLTGGIRIKFV